MRFSKTLLSSVLALSTAGCYSATFDENADAVFACTITDNAEPDADCPGSMVCNGSVCVEEAPTATVMNPEDRNAVAEGTAVTVTIQTSGFDFSSDDDDPDAGFLQVSFDNELFEVREGAGGLLTFEFDQPLTPGPHRIAVQVFRADGTPFGNDEASDTRLFWVDNGEPHVAITKPWPGSQFDTQSSDPVEVEVAVLNFRYGAANTDIEDGIGHVHVYYDQPFPDCAEDPTCDAGYIGVVSAAPEEAALGLDLLSSSVILPEGAVGDDTLSAVLRQNDHAALTNSDGDFVVDTIEIERTAD